MKRRRSHHHREILALTRVRQLGNRKILQLLNHFESPAAIFSASREQFQGMDGIGAAIVSQITGFNRWDEVDRLLERAEESGIDVLTPLDPDYPELLRQIHDAPPLLWVRGRVKALSGPGVAVVGTRSPDRYGREQARLWSRNLSREGLTIISGLAYGVDTLAHQEALAEGGQTTAVLGSGLNCIYPEENLALARQIVESGGAVISEYPPDTAPLPRHFPVRNRIVSGLSLGVLVVQSGVKGGSMITARSALDQNREVFVIPHALGYKRGEGNNALIKQSQGKLVQTPEDLLEEIQFSPEVSASPMGLQSPGPKTDSRQRGSARHALPVGPKPISNSDKLSRSGDSRRTHHQFGLFGSGNLSSLTPVQQELCNCLGDGRMQLDRLSEAVDIPPGRLLNLLLELELKGLVVQRAGKYFELR